MSDWEVKVEAGGGGSPVILEAGYALPGSFTVRARRGGLAVEIDAEGKGGRVRARRVVVESDAPHGAGSATLREVPVRTLMNAGALDVLQEVRWEGETARLVEVAEPTEDARDVVSRAIGYNVEGAS